MLKGTVKFRARVVDTERGLTIPQTCEFNPLDETGVEKVEIECPDGTEIVITVHFNNVDNAEHGIAIATDIQKLILDRISFARDIAIENGRAEPNLDPINGQTNFITPQAGDLVIVSDRQKVSLSLPCADLKPILEEAAPKGERFFGFLRSARLSISPVEEFMHLYHILLMLFGDSQPKVDKFIRKRNPGTPLTPDPRKGKGHIIETVYRRLRNEFGHTDRPQLNINETKTEMIKRLDELRAITKRAIESCS